MTEARHIPIDAQAIEPAVADTPANSDSDTPNGAPTAPDNGPAELERQLAEAKDLAALNYDKMLRMAAELDNCKKRAARDLDEMRKFANEAVFRDLLDVQDNLHRALDAAKAKDATLDGLGEGVNLTLAQLEKIFDRYNVKPIASLGEPFDPRFHQAMMQEPTEAHPANVVIKELQRGFTIHDRLLRPAMVVVSAPPAG